MQLPRKVPFMTSLDYTIYLVVLIALFAGVVFWAFSQKRKKRFEKDGKIPFQE